MTSVAASSPSSSSSSIVVMHVDTSDMRPILKEAFGKNVEIATISNNGLIPAKYLYEGLQNYTEGIVANHGGGGGGDDDEDAQRTADGVTAIKKNIGIILKEILNDNLRTALTPFDRDGDGTIDAEELQQAAKDHQTVLMSRKILAWFSFVLFLFMIIVSGGLSVGIYYIVFSLKDTYVNPSTGLMMVKAPDGSTDSNTAGIGIELPTRTLGQGVTITSQGTMGGRTCYSSDSVANMFVNVATGVTTSLAETNQDTDELHVYHLGNSDCDESNIVWSNKDVQLGCVVMVPSLECTNMVRRGRYLSEFADTDAMQDRHRSLKEHVANMIVGATTGGHGPSIDRSNRNLEDGKIYYTYALPTGTCTDSEEVLYKLKKWGEKNCKYVSELNDMEKKKRVCKKTTTNPNRGKVYDLCQKTCATVGLGPCKGSFVEAAAPDCTAVTAEKDVTISGLEDELEDKDSTIESLIAELSLKDDTTDTPNDDPSPAGTSPAGTSPAGSCSLGYYVYNGECSPCNAGKRGTNGDTCEPCSAGTYNGFLGQSECIPCPVDTFSDVVGSTSKLNCKFCPQGKTITTTGATSEDQCTNCPVNTYGIPQDPYSFTAGCRSCSNVDYPVNTNYGTTTCGKTGAKSYEGCAFDTPADQNPDCVETRGTFFGSVEGGPRLTAGCRKHQYCFPNDGDERPQPSPRDDNYHSES